MLANAGNYLEAQGFDDSYRQTGNGQVELVSNEGSASSRLLDFVAGVVPSEQAKSFERALFRVSKGNIISRFDEEETSLRDPSTGEVRTKRVFLLFYRGDFSENIIEKLCKFFEASKYDYPSDRSERAEKIAALEADISDKALTIQQSEERRSEIFDPKGKVATDLPVWRRGLNREKLVYHTLNMFQIQERNTIQIGKCWCPTNRVADVKDALVRATPADQAPNVCLEMETTDARPTYLRTNKYTEVFQVLTFSLSSSLPIFLSSYLSLSAVSLFLLLLSVCLFFQTDARVFSHRASSTRTACLATRR